MTSSPPFSLPSPFLGILSRLTLPTTTCLLTTLASLQLLYLLAWSPRSSSPVTSHCQLSLSPSSLDFNKRLDRGLTLTAFSILSNSLSLSRSNPDRRSSSLSRPPINQPTPLTSLPRRDLKQLVSNTASLPVYTPLYIPFGALNPLFLVYSGLYTAWPLSP